VTPWVKAISALIGYRPAPSPFDGKDIEYAFTSNKVDYYCFKGSGFSMYYERYAAAMDAINACNKHRLTGAEFDVFLDSLTVYHNNGELVNAALLVDNIKAIRQYCYSLPLLYNLAAVWYFDKTESPYVLDKEYCEEKIARWMKNKATLAFFLKTPMLGYTHWQDSFEGNFQSYIKQSTETQIAIYERLLSNLSETENASDTIKNLRKVMDRLKESLHLVE
jgi:hypothetical protein